MRGGAALNFKNAKSRLRSPSFYSVQRAHALPRAFQLAVEAQLGAAKGAVKEALARKIGARVRDARDALDATRLLELAAREQQLLARRLARIVLVAANVALLVRRDRAAERDAKVRWVKVLDKRCQHGVVNALEVGVALVLPLAQIGAHALNVAQRVNHACRRRGARRALDGAQRRRAGRAHILRLAAHALQLANERVGVRHHVLGRLELAGARANALHQRAVGGLELAQRHHDAERAHMHRLLQTKRLFGGAHARAIGKRAQIAIARGQRAHVDAGGGGRRAGAERAREHAACKRGAIARRAARAAARARLARRRHAVACRDIHFSSTAVDVFGSTFVLSRARTHTHSSILTTLYFSATCMRRCGALRGVARRYVQRVGAQRVERDGGAARSAMLAHNTKLVVGGGGIAHRKAQYYRVARRAQRLVARHCRLQLRHESGVHFREPPQRFV